MIRILAVALRRQTTSTIFRTQKPKITSCYEELFRHDAALRLFCCCTSEPNKAADDTVEYPLEVRKTNKVISVVRK